MGRPGEENLRKSREYFEQAIQKDPAYSLAWAGLADTLRRSASFGVLSHQDAYPRVRMAAEKALALDNSLAEPLVALGAVKMQYEWDWAGAERLYKQAIALSPTYGTAHHEYATYLAEVGRTQEAVAEARRAREVEPLSRIFAFNVTWKLYVARRYGEAESEFGKLSAWRPDSRGSIPLASVYLQTGRQREAIAELRKSVEESHRGVFELMFLGHALGVSGARSEAEKCSTKCAQCRNEGTFHLCTSPCCTRASAKGTRRCSGSKLQGTGYQRLDSRGPPARPDSE